MVSGLISKYIYYIFLECMNLSIRIGVNERRNEEKLKNGGFEFI